MVHQLIKVFSKTQLSKVEQFGRFVFGPPISPDKEITRFNNEFLCKKY